MKLITEATSNCTFDFFTHFKTTESVVLMIQWREINVNQKETLV